MEPLNTLDPEALARFRAVAVRKMASITPFTDWTKAQFAAPPSEHGRILTLGGICCFVSHHDATQKEATP